MRPEPCRPVFDLDDGEDVDRPVVREANRWGSADWRTHVGPCEVGSEVANPARSRASQVCADLEVLLERDLGRCRGRPRGPRRRTTGRESRQGGRTWAAGDSDAWGVTRWSSRTDVFGRLGSTARVV